MKKIGKQVLFIEAKEGNPRNGEGTFLRLNDGGILHVYTYYYDGTDWADHATAKLCGCVSYDEGETWSDSYVIIEKDENAQNIMSPSLIRMKNGEIGMIYLRKEVMPDNGITCMPVIVRSSDEGKTWTNFEFCVEKMGYYCAINDGAIVQKNGRILVPMSYAGRRYDAFGTCTLKDLEKEKSGYSYIAYSDDNGRTWGMIENEFKSPYSDGWGLAEPGIYEYEDGTLWIWFRTPYGFQYESRSKDGGKTWSAVEPNFNFSSPDSPMRVKPVGKYTVAVYNPVPMYSLCEDKEVWGSAKRTPFVCAISKDGGRLFESHGKTLANDGIRGFLDSLYLLEDDRTNSYCYPAIIGTKDGFLITYYHSNNTPVCLNSTKITKVKFEEIE